MADITTPLVLVTGVSGYIASWVAHAALKAGYRVRGTVRSLANEKKVSHLRDLCPGSRYQIELVEAELLSDDGWDAAVSGCTYILHVASPCPIAEPRDEDELIKPAVDGTLRVLRAVSRMATPSKRVVITSSEVAIHFGNPREKTTFTDTDWTMVDSGIPLTAYFKSKTLAEKAAWDFVAALPEDRRFELCTINPSFVLGPMLSTSGCISADMMKQLVMGEMFALPDMYFNIVSVFDVARAHLLAMTNPDAPGKRFLCTSGALTFREMAGILAKEMKPLGYPVTTWEVPAFMVHILSFLGDRNATAGICFLGMYHTLVPSNARNILGLQLRPDLGIVKEMLYAAIHAGIIPDKTADQRLVRDYVRPAFDTSMIPAAP